MNIAFIPVRGGSKSIPLKNIKEIAGHPLVYWTARAANDAQCIDKVILATDSEKIKEVVNTLNFPKILLYDRDSANATDISSTESVMLEYINKSNFAPEDVFFLIQATSPLLSSQMIDNMFSAFRKSGTDSALSCVRIKRFYWNENGTPINYNFQMRPRRQDFPGCLAENGACYINLIGNILRDKCRLSGRVFIYEMPEKTAVEIDEPADWPIVEKLLRAENPHTGFSGKTFCFDIDGVLGETADVKDLGGDYTKNTPNHKLIAWCNGLYNAGNKIILHTARGSGTGKDWRTVTEKQMADWGVQYHEIYFGKPAADYYIDDKMLDVYLLK